MKSIMRHGCSSRTKKLRRQAPLHLLVMRDIDRYVHLISAGPLAWVLKTVQNPSEQRRCNDTVLQKSVLRNSSAT